MTRQDTSADIGLESATHDPRWSRIPCATRPIRTNVFPAVAGGVTYFLNSNHVSRSVASNTIV